MRRCNQTTAITAGLLVVALVGLYALPASAHTPVPGPDFAGCRTLGGGSEPYAPLPVFPTDPIDAPVDFTNARENYDFCAYADTIYCSLSGVAGLADEVGEFAGLVQCRYADINGPLNLEADIPVTPNGMLDAQYELGILAAVLNNPADPLFEDARAAFEYNYQALKDLVMEALSVASLKSDNKDLRGIVNLMAPHLVGSLVGVLAGFATLGDDMTNAALDELLGLLEDIGLEAPEGGIGSITNGIPVLGPDGNVDGGCFTNMQTYNYFVNELGYSPEQFIAAVFDPNQVPPMEWFVATPRVSVGAKTGFIRLGDEVVVTLSEQNFLEPAESVSWFKDGAPLVDLTNIRAWTIPAMTLDDEGLYRVAVQTVRVMADKDDDCFQTQPVTLTAYLHLTVFDSQLPAGSLFGLATIAGLCALAGALKLRSRK